MSKKFNIREWVLSVKYWSLLFIPHVAICLIFLIYTLVGASIIQEIESDDLRTTSSVIVETTAPNILTKNLDRERERLLSKIVEKRQSSDLQQYIKFVNKHIREYEEELKKTYKSTSTPLVVEKFSNDEGNARWTFAGSLFFIGTTLTTIGSNDFIPITNIGKFFLMIYAAIGIPLTLVFLSDLSLLITRLIKYLSLLLLRIYSTHYFLHIRQWLFFRFIEKQLNISIPTATEEEDLFSPKLNNQLFDQHFNDNGSPKIDRPTLRQRRLSHRIHIKNIQKIYNILIETLKDIDDDIDLTMPQLIITLFIYLLIGACLISSNSYFDSIYICFTSLFTINLGNYYRRTTMNHENNTRSMFTLAIYLLFGLAIVSLCIKAVQMRIQTILGEIGKKLLRDLVEFLRQMGFHELSTDDILSTTDLNSHPTAGSTTSDNISSRHQRVGRTSSNPPELLLPSPFPRPIGIAEPVRRLSTGLIIRAFKKSSDDTSNDKSVQVNTIIRSCGRCAGSTPSPSNSMLSVRKNSLVSAASSSGDASSGCEDDDNTLLTLPPPNLDRLRQRRATLVAKTIISQMATQPLPSSIDEPMPSLTLLTAQRHRTADSSLPTLPKYPTKKIAASPPSTPRKRAVSEEEFLTISKQISSLLTPSDDES